jgi:hypothetical protein
MTLNDVGVPEVQIRAKVCRQAKVGRVEEELRKRMIRSGKF